MPCPSRRCYAPATRRCWWRAPCAFASRPCRPRQQGGGRGEADVRQVVLDADAFAGAVPDGLTRLCVWCPGGGHVLGWSACSSAGTGAAASPGHCVIDVAAGRPKVRIRGRCVAYHPRRCTAAVCMWAVPQGVRRFVTGATYSLLHSPGGCLSQLLASDGAPSAGLLCYCGLPLRSGRRGVAAEGVGAGLRTRQLIE